MLLFKKPFWDPIVRGEITMTFRRWQRPQVKPGGRYRCHPIGVLEVDEVAPSVVGAISDAAAVSAGFADREELVAYLAELGPVDAETQVFRVRFHHGGDGDRVELALDATLTEADVAEICARLARLD